ncbi:MAG: peptidylprolyl isomerase, partial [Thiohalomonadales bacterium]
MVSIVNKDKTYTIHYSIKDRHGTILEKSPDDTPLTFTPGDGSVLAVIEQAVINAGDIKKINLTVLPKEAFGEFDPFLIFQVKRRAFQSNEPLK